MVKVFEQRGVGLIEGRQTVRGAEHAPTGSAFRDADAAVRVPDIGNGARWRDIQPDDRDQADLRFNEPPCQQEAFAVLITAIAIAQPSGLLIELEGTAGA